MNKSTVDSASRDPAGASVLWDATFGWFLLLQFLLNVGQGVFAPLLPQIMGGLSLSFAATGFLGAAHGISRFLVDLPAGLLAERLGIPLVLHTGVAFLLVGTVLSAWVSSFPAMLLARGLIGLGSGMTMVISILYLMRRGPASQRGRRANLYEMAAIAGLAVSSDAGGMVAGRWGWRWSFVMAALVVVVAWIVGAGRVLPGIRQILEDEDPPAAPSTRQVQSGSVGAALAVYIAVFSQAFAWGGGISTFLPLYGGQELHLDPGTIGRTMAIAFGVEVGLLLPVGWAVDLWGKFNVLVPGFLSMLFGTLLSPYVHTVLGFGTALTLLTVGMSVWMVAPAMLAEQSAGRFRGRAAGMYRLVVDLGFIVGPALIGWLIDLSGFQAGAAVLALILGTSILVSIWFFRPSATLLLRKHT